MGYGYGYYGIDFTYLVLVIPALLISLYAQFKVKSAFARYSQERCVTGLTGAEAARRILQANGITDIAIEHIPGSLTDHYAPNDKVIRLSDDVYNVPSIAAVGVAAHECGHACTNPSTQRDYPCHADRLYALLPAAAGRPHAELPAVGADRHRALQSCDGFSAYYVAGGIRCFQPRAENH